MGVDIVTSVDIADDRADAGLRARLLHRAIGRVVRDARSSLGWTQKKLGDEAGIKTSLLSKLESGDRRLTGATLAKLKDAFSGKLDVPIESQISRRVEDVLADTQGADRTTLLALLEEFDDEPRLPWDELLGLLASTKSAKGGGSALSRDAFFGDFAGLADLAQSMRPPGKPASHKGRRAKPSRSTRPQAGNSAYDELRETAEQVTRIAAEDVVSRTAALPYPNNVERLIQVQQLLNLAVDLPDEQLRALVYSAARQS